MAASHHGAPGLIRTPAAVLDIFDPFAPEPPEPLPEGLLDRLELFKNIAIAHATGEAADEAGFKLLRRQFISEPLIKSALPSWVQSCRDFGEFWSFIQPKFKSYAERRAYIRESLDKALSIAENAIMSADQDISDALSVVDSEHVRLAWKRCAERVSADPEAAVTAARSLLETVCKQILHDEGVAELDKFDLPQLYYEVSTRLNLAPSGHTEPCFKKILGACSTVVNEMATLRNRLSDSHGKSPAAVRPAPRHARLAVGFAGTMAVFLIETHEFRRQDDK